MVAVLAGIAAAGVVAGIASAALSASQAKRQAKLQKEAGKAGAEFKYKQTIEQSEFEERTNRERVRLEQGAQTRAASLERNQTQEALGVEVASLDQKIGGEQELSTLRQNDMARKSRADISAMRAGAITSGLSYAGTARDVVQQSATFARLEQITSAYESALGVRGMQFDRAALMLKGRQANEAFDFTVGAVNDSAEQAVRQGRESLELTRELAVEAKELEKKYAEVGYRTESNRINTQAAVNIASSVIGGATQAYGLYLQSQSAA